MMDMHMKMVAWFGADASFVISALTTGKEDYGLFTLGCLCTVVICIGHMYLPIVRNNLTLLH